MPDDDRTLELVMGVLDALDELGDSQALVGGCATNLLTTIVRSEMRRPTDDVDVVVGVTSLPEYYQVQDKMRDLGFEPDQDDDAPICRMIRDGLKIDLLPAQPIELGFHNRWYGLAIETAESVPLPGSRRCIRLIRAPVFVATKLEALSNRGEDDIALSHDLEDIVTVVDGRPELVDEVKNAEPELRSFIASRLRALLEQAGFRSSLAGHLPGDSASQGRLEDLIDKLEMLSDPSVP